MNCCGTVGCTLGLFVASGLGEKHGIKAKVVKENCEHHGGGSTIITQELDFYYNRFSFNAGACSFAAAFFGLDEKKAEFLFNIRPGYDEEGQEGKDESIRRIKWLLSGKKLNAYEDKYYN